MSKESIVTGIIALLLGVVVAGFAAGQAVNSNNTNMLRMMGVDTDKTHIRAASTSHKDMTMTEMHEQLQNKSGDDFDKAFIEMMIAHHEGAIDMAQIAKTHAKHDEIKALSDRIVSAQTKEINEMKEWQTMWDYSSNDAMHMMHGN